MKKLIYLVMVTSLFQGLYAQDEVIESGTLLYSEVDSTVNNKGEYNFERYVLRNPIYFFSDSSIYYMNYGGFLDSSGFRLERYTELDLKEIQKGEFSVNGDTVKVTTFIRLYKRGMDAHYCRAHFQGIFSDNRDTIWDWRIVKPFPKYNPRYNRNFGALKKPHVLVRKDGSPLSGLEKVLFPSER